MKNHTVCIPARLSIFKTEDVQKYYSKLNLLQLSHSMFCKNIAPLAIARKHYKVLTRCPHSCQQDSIIIETDLDHMLDEYNLQCRALCRCQKWHHTFLCLCRFSGDKYQYMGCTLSRMKNLQKKSKIALQIYSSHQDPTDLVSKGVKMWLEQIIILNLSSIESSSLSTLPQPQCHSDSHSRSHSLARAIAIDIAIAIA